MNKCVNCGAEFDGKLCPNCGYAPESECAAESSNVTADHALKERIKRDWYTTVWAQENRKDNRTHLLLHILGSLIGLAGIALIILVFFETSDISGDLKKCDPSSVIETYNGIMDKFYLYAMLGIVLFILSSVITDVNNQWQREKQFAWVNGLKLDKRQLAVEIIESGKSHINYKDAVLYLYNESHGIKRSTWKSVIISSVVFSAIVAVVGAICIVWFKGVAEEALESVLTGEPVASSIINLNSNHTVDIIFIVLLVVLIAVMLIVPFVKYKRTFKKAEAWVNEQMSKGSFRH